MPLETSSIESHQAEMKAARQEWMRASEKVKQAIAQLRDLSLPDPPADAELALKNAARHEAQALEKYIAAVDRYDDAVLRAGGTVQP
jgi:hypothetical protein